MQGLDSDDLILLADHARKIKKRKAPRVKPVNGDFYAVKDDLVPEERAILERVETVMAEKVHPIVTDAWMKGEFPPALIDVFKERVSREGFPHGHVPAGDVDGAGIDGR